MFVKKVFVLLLLFVAVAETKLLNGFDITFSTVTVATFKKFKSAGFSFYVQRLGRTDGQIDANGLSNLKNAYDAGFTDVSAYIWPCGKPVCKENAIQQMANVINALQVKNLTINTLWIVIESGYWQRPLNTTYNRKFIKDMVDTAENASYSVGIYLTHGWEDFGGWTKPYSRQWDQNHEEFGVEFVPIVK
uniref:Uncharacterized protein n=1 Tax=Panagrolaimus sp. ES5 TaxID=591445 RepID=A0AC34FSB4_9BILA